MRTLFALLFIFALSVDRADAAEVKVDSRIDAVQVFPTGAQITRLAKFKLNGGEHTLFLAEIPAGAIASSIRVEGRATGKLEIGSVDTRRVSVPRTDPAAAASERRRIEGEIEKLQDSRSGVEATIKTAEMQQTLIGNLAELPKQQPPASGPAVAPDWNQLFGLIGARMTEVRQAILDGNQRLRDIDRQIADLKKKLGEAAPSRDERTEVKVNVISGGDIDVDLVVSYQIGNAGWQAFYDARLSTGAKNVAPQLALVRRAAIWQRTGEDWSEVALSLSTTRPGAGTAAAELYPVTVDFKPDIPPPPPAPPVVMAPAPPAAPSGSRFKRSAGRGGDDEDRVAASAETAVEQRAKVEAAPFQSVFIVPGRITVQSNGEQKRVQITEESIEPTLIARTVPRLDAKAYLYAKLTMPKGTPYLPGQVSLFRDGTFVGSGRLPLLAPGEEHELGFGSDDSVRVRHVIADERRSESGLISTTKAESRNFRIIIRNLHERPLQIVVLDQMPVSQNQDIKVELIGKTAPTKRDVNDRRGVLSWDLRLEADEERTIDFGYRVSWPAGKNLQYGGEGR
jgi:uncharacterized protein (TIGR02231 family)